MRGTGNDLMKRLLPLFVNDCSGKHRPNWCPEAPCSWPDDTNGHEGTSPLLTSSKHPILISHEFSLTSCACALLKIIRGAPTITNMSQSYQLIKTTIHRHSGPFMPIHTSNSALNAVSALSACQASRSTLGSKTHLKQKHHKAVNICWFGQA